MLGWREVGIPEREIHNADPLDVDQFLLLSQQRFPHRSRWRLTPHRGDNCVWVKVRIPRGTVTYKAVYRLVVVPVSGAP